MLRASVWGVVKRSGVVGLSSGSLSLSVPFRRLVASGGVNRRWVATVPKKVQMEPSAAAPVTPKDTELILQQNSLLSKEQRRELVLSPPALVVTREYEWGNILIGFEQANKYTIRAAPGGQVVGFIAEEDSLAKSVTRNFLRTHRSFKATILDSAGEPIFAIRRPFYMFSSSMFVETPENEIMGEIHMDWHVYRRRYNLYNADKVQFARVDSGFLGIDFDMRDDENRKMACVNKDFTGFAREIFTDARQYVIRMKPDYVGEDISPDGFVKQDVKPDLADQYSPQKLTLNERATVLACAVSIDFDYFSLHGGGGVLGGGLPFFAPLPVPGGASGEIAPQSGAEVGDVPSGVAGAGAAGTASESVPAGAGPYDPASSTGHEAAPSDSRWGSFEPGGQDFHEPEFAEPDFGDDSGDDDGGFGIGDVLGAFFGDDE